MTAATDCPRCDWPPEYCRCPEGRARRQANGYHESQPQATLRPYDLAQYIRNGVPEPELLANGMLYKGGLHSIAGPPDCGKTTLTYWWALSLLRDGHTVAILDEECGAEMAAEKLIAFGATENNIRGLRYFPFLGRTWTPIDIGALHSELWEHQPAAVIWDSSAAFLARAGRDEDRAPDVTSFWAEVLTPCARRFGAAVLVIDHDKKDGGASRYARGSGAKLAATDVAYKIDAIKPFTRAQDGILAITVTKDRRGWLQRSWRAEVTRNPLALSVKPAEAATDGPGLTPAEQKLLGALTAEPSTRRQIVDRIAAQHGHGLTDKTVRKGLTALLEAGLADQIPAEPGRSDYWLLRDPGTP